MIKINTSIILLSLTCIFFPLSGCTKTETPVAAGIKKQILHKGNQTEPEDLDPHIVTGLPEIRILMALFEGLVAMDPVDLHPTPGIAQNWEISEDGRTYVFNLREDAKWSNGEPLTAEDFIFSFKRILSPSLGAPYAYFLHGIKGGEAYNKGQISDFNQVGVKALDKHKLSIELNEPIPYFLSLLTHVAFYPVHKGTLEESGPVNERGTGWARPEKMVSNGPFALKKWSIGDSVGVEKNPHYWDAQNVKLNKIYFYPIEDPNTEESAFRTGQIHITETLPITKIKQYRDRKDPHLRLAPFFMTYGFIFNTTIPPFNDVKVRKALSLALDRNSIVENVTRKGEFPAFSYVPPNSGGYQSSSQISEDVKEARALLAEAGFPDGKGFPVATLLYNTSENHRSVAEALQYMWSKNLGVNIELINQEWKVYLQARAGNTYNLIRFGWVGDYLDPSAFLEVFTQDSGNNYSKWTNKNYDELLSNASATLDKNERFRLYNKAETILLDELPVLPLFFYNTSYLVHESVRNWHPNILDFHPYKYVYLEE